MASNRNELTIEGNLVRDPELRTTKSQTAVATFCIASNRFYKKGDGFEKETSFFDIQCWGRLAQEVSNDLFKGSAVSVTGRLKQERWTGQDGRSNSKIIIVAERIMPIPKNNNGDSYKGEEPNYNEAPF
jgi:single-strand DNA-binding protein